MTKSIPVLCVLDIESNNVSVLESVPEHISPGQVSAKQQGGRAVHICGAFYNWGGVYILAPPINRLSLALF